MTVTVRRDHRTPNVWDWPADDVTYDAAVDP